MFTDYPLSASDATVPRYVDAYETADRLGNRSRYPKGGRLAVRFQNANLALSDAKRHAENLSKHEAWLAACAWDLIDPTSPFVEFSDENPYAERYDSLTLTR